MILVTTGTNGAAFDRLLVVVAGLDIDEPIVVQRGPSQLQQPKASCVDYLPFDELANLVREARVVVTHGGVGSILVSHMNGKHPLVVPRLARFNEAVDDHQLELGLRLNEIGLITLVEEPARLPDLIEGATPLTSVAHRPTSSRLVLELADYVAEVTAARAAR